MMARNKAVGGLLALAGLGVYGLISSLCPGPFSVYRAEVASPAENAATANADRLAAPLVSHSRPPPISVCRIVAYPSRFRSFTVTGEVVNNTAQNVTGLKVTGLFHEPIHICPSKAFAYADLSALEPGEAAPFRLILTQVARRVDRYELLVEYEPSVTAPLRLEILNPAGYAPRAGWYRLTGAVRNPHPFTVAGIKIVATCYDAQDNVTGTDWTFCEACVLPPGQTSPFDFRIIEMPSSVCRYRLQTEAMPSSIG